MRVIRRDCKHTAVRGRKATATHIGVDGTDDRNATRQCDIEQAFQKTVARSAGTWKTR